MFRLLSRGTQWLKAHPTYSLLIGCLLILIVLNVSAFFHAYSMTHFVQGGVRTSHPESLGFFEKIKVIAMGVRIPRPVNVIDASDMDLPRVVHVYKNSGQTYEGWHIPTANSKGMCILFHGYCGTKSGLIKEARAFLELGYECFLVDFRGSGGSSGSDTSIGFHEAEDVLAAMQFVKENINSSPPILYGQSMGSASILRAVGVLGAKPKALVLETPFARLSTTVRNRFALMGIPSFPCAEFVLFWGGVIQGYSTYAHNPVAYAKGVRCPVLLMAGQHDNRVRVSEAQSICDNFIGEKTFVIIEEAKHESLLPANPKQWKEAVSGFLLSSCD